MLTERQAFEAMALFLERFYGEAGNDMETLMADISILPDGRTLDPAAWEDWMACVRRVTNPTTE